MAGEHSSWCNRGIGELVLPKKTYGAWLIQPSKVKEPSRNVAEFQRTRRITKIIQVWKRKGVRKEKEVNGKKNRTEDSGTYFNYATYFKRILAESKALNEKWFSIIKCKLQSAEQDSGSELSLRIVQMKTSALTFDNGRAETELNLF